MTSALRPPVNNGHHFWVRMVAVENQITENKPKFCFSIFSDFFPFLHDDPRIQRKFDWEEWNNSDWKGEDGAGRSHHTLHRGITFRVAIWPLKRAKQPNLALFKTVSQKWKCLEFWPIFSLFWMLKKIVLFTVCFGKIATKLTKF